jgi:hypothetical protein
MQPMPEMTRVTIRIPIAAARRMELRARMLGQPANTEYVRAVDHLVGSDNEWIELHLAQPDIVDWLNESEILEAQFSPVLVFPSSRNGTPNGFTVMGRVVAIERQWFPSGDAYRRARAALAGSGAHQLVSNPDPTDNTEETRVVFGWLGLPGSRPRRP